MSDETLAAVKGIHNPETLGEYYLGEGFIYELERAHSDVGETYFLPAINPDKVVSDADRLNIDNFTAVAICTEVEATEDGDHPLHVEIPFVDSELPVGVRRSFIRTVIEDIEKQHAGEDQGIEVDLPTEVMDERIKTIFAELGYVALDSDDVHCLLAKPPAEQESMEHLQLLVSEPSGQPDREMSLAA